MILCAPEQRSLIQNHRIHWAAFSLAFHDWAEPIERVIKAAKERKVSITTPKIGEAVIVGSAEYPVSTWWR